MRERGRERERERKSVFECVGEEEGERERERKKECVWERERGRERVIDEKKQCKLNEFFSPLFNFLAIFFPKYKVQK